MTYKSIIYLSLLNLALLSSCRKSDYVLPESKKVITDNGAGTGTVTWTKDQDLLLQGFVFVNENQVLTIEPGTVVRFKAGQGATASALIVARGGKIMANGTSDEPIIFTSESDNLKSSLPNNSTGLWGGIIILGRAPLNNSANENMIEGIPTTEPRAVYGGRIPDDNSGELSFVSIRYPGTILGDGNEINGLTLGGVGSETTIHHLEVINSADDGIEFFGGTVNIKYIISVNAEDDALDYDMGYSGYGQFLLAVQQYPYGNNLCEAGGGTNPVNGIPYSTPVFANVTFVGNVNSSNGRVISFERFAGGTFVNSIFYNQNKGFFLEYNNGLSDCWAQWQNGNINIENNIIYQVDSNRIDRIFRLTGSVVDSSYHKQWEAYLNAGNNQLIDPGLDLSAETPSYFPTLATGNNLYDLNNDWFETTNFKGAFGTYDWTSGWTIYKTIIQNN